MSDISNPIIENALQGNLVELSHRNEQTHLQIRTLNEMVVSLRDENAKLRELVRMQDECIASNCEWCKHRKNRESLDVECELDDLARELGIEVADA